jgi:hypothetical protein
MRRFALAVCAVLGLLAVPVTAAHADPSAAPTLPVPSAVPGQPVCNVDASLGGLTGLVATASGGYAVVNKANTYTMKVYLLDNKCQRTGSVTYTGNPNGGARDPRDLISPDGATFWVADTGDDIQNPSRPTIALWKLPANGTKGTMYHFTYPDGAHPADAMLLNGDGTPIFVTRVASGPSGIYVPDGQMVPLTPVKLKKVGQFTPQHTGTDNKLGPVGEQSVTGGAVAPDGKHVALRTLSDAYEWSVPDGDVVKALTTTNPVITPLPSEPDGEAITYSRDGKSFLSLTSQASGDTWSILSYTPAVAPSPTKSAAVPGGGGGAAPKGDARGWFSKLTLQQLTYLVGGVGLVGLLMVLGGILGIRSARNRPRPVQTNRTRPSSTDRWSDEQDSGGPHAPVPDVGFPPGQGPYGADYPSGRGGYQGQGGYPPSGYSEGPGYGGAGSPRGGRAYRGGSDPGRYEDSGGQYQSGPAAGGGRSGGGSGTYSSGYDPYGSGNGYGGSGNGYDGGSDNGYGGGDNGYGGSDQGGYASAPDQPTARDTRDGGIAKSHRGRAPRSRGVASPKGGYSDEHEGFDDLRRLTKED